MNKFDCSCLITWPLPTGFQGSPIDFRRLSATATLCTQHSLSRVTPIRAVNIIQVWVSGKRDLEIILSLALVRHRTTGSSVIVTHLYDSDCSKRETYRKQRAPASGPIEPTLWKKGAGSAKHVSGASRSKANSRTLQVLEKLEPVQKKTCHISVLRNQQHNI